MQGHRAPPGPRSPSWGMEPFPGMWSPSEDMDSFPGREAFSGHGVIPEEMESIFGKLHLQIFQQLSNSGLSLPAQRQLLCWAVLEGGVAGRMGQGLGMEWLAS